MKNKRNAILIGLLGFVLTLCLCTLFAVVGSMTADTEDLADMVTRQTVALAEIQAQQTIAAIPTEMPPTATDTPEPTETVLPTATLEPTETATPDPTNTPRPTRTPRPTATVDSGAAYRVMLVENVTDLSEVLDTYTSLFGRAGQDISLIYSSDWQDDVTEQVVALYVICEDARLLVPPAELRETHDEYMAACDDYEQSGAAILLFLEDPLESAYLDLAQSFIQQGTVHIEEATRLLREL